MKKRFLLLGDLPLFAYTYPLLAIWTSSCSKWT